MELILGVIATGVTESIKLLSQKFGQKLSKRIVHGIVFVLCFIGTYTVTSGLISWETIQHYIQIFTASYATYNLIVKPVKNNLKK